MNFDVYFAFKNKEGIVCPGIKPTRMSWSEIMAVCKNNEGIVDAYRNGDKERKKWMPAVCFVGRCVKGTRKSENMKPTQYVMIDIDHVKDPRLAWEQIASEIAKNEDNAFVKSLRVAHVTISGQGLRLVFKAYQDIDSLFGQMEFYNSVLNFNAYGDYDSVCKNLDRISFLCKPSDFLYVSDALIKEMNEESDELPEGPIVKANEEVAEHGEIFEAAEVEEFTEDEKAKFDELDYRGTPVKVIIEKYVEVQGKPSSGEVHNYYNELVKNFRCITSNDKRALLYLLPRFGHSSAECWSQIKSICRVNTLSRLEKSFYFFLKDNGFYTDRKGNAMKDYLMAESDPEDDEQCPYLPPVFRELVGSAPKDFIASAVNGLLPIMGTLSSYVGAVYPYDGRVHTTSFFSIIYAPPGTGKGFVERFLDMLFEDLKLRDMVQEERENVYLRAINKKGQNERSPDLPHTSLRQIPPKNSETEFLQKQRDNHGYHMFTYAAEMDSWSKGVKAAGGNKDDMIRIAWDNGEYGQAFKSANSFKGTVRLYWNVLITGTMDQVERYFKNVENGLVTRCSFTSIENQEFAEAPIWRPISTRGLAVIRKYMDRCDSNTYETPCNVDVTQLLSVNDDDFDKEIEWRFKFKPRQMVDLSWIMPTIDKFHKEQMALGAQNVDHARDVFRRRVGVRGFRLALLCMTLWENPRPSDLEKCKSFIWWWMHQDIKMMLKLWGDKYNALQQDVTKQSQPFVFEQLADKFNRNDVYVVCTKQGIRTPIRRILFDWKRLGFVKQIDKDNFEKSKKK